MRMPRQPPALVLAGAQLGVASRHGARFYRMPLLQLGAGAVHRSLADHRMPLKLGRELGQELLALGRRHRRGGLLDGEIEVFGQGERHEAPEEREERLAIMAPCQ
jgi:hypothetical protein